MCKVQRLAERRRAQEGSKWGKYYDREIKRNGSKLLH